MCKPHRPGSNGPGMASYIRPGTRAVDGKRSRGMSRLDGNGSPSDGPTRAGHAPMFAVPKRLAHSNHRVTNTR
jgi:hypothetical protein